MRMHDLIANNEHFLNQDTIYLPKINFLYTMCTYYVYILWILAFVHYLFFGSASPWLRAKDGLKKPIFIGKPRFKVDFSSKYRKIDPNPQNIGVLGAKSGLKKSIFPGKPDLRSILLKT